MQWFDIAVSFLLGIFLTIPYFYLVGHFGDDERKQRHLLGIGLMGAAMVYIGFALVWGSSTVQQDETSSTTNMSYSNVLLLETAGLFVYATCYLFSLVFQSNLWLALGWILHPLWDILLHWGPDARASHVAPQWYVLACVAFDVIVAGYIIHQSVITAKIKCIDDNRNGGKKGK